MKLLKKLGSLLLVLCLVLSPLSASTELDFLDNLSLEITTLEKTWNNLDSQLKVQSNKFQILENQTQTLTKQSNQQTKQLMNLEQTTQTLKPQVSKLETQFKELNKSLIRKEKELQTQKKINTYLIGGVVICLAVSTISVLNSKL